MVFVVGGGAASLNEQCSVSSSVDDSIVVAVAMKARNDLYPSAFVFF